MKKDDVAKSQEMFKGLVENGLDFLETSVNELKDNKPKYSIIHFSSGIEIILKARLMLEHWSLIVEDQYPHFNRFRDGHSLTVGIAGAIRSLKEVVGLVFPRGSEDCFDQINRHRNRIIHFFHTQNENDISQIASEQCRGWLYLYQLLSKDWKKDFIEFQEKIERLNKLMHTIRQFLEKKFESLKPEIANLTRQSINIVECKSCGFEAAKEEELELPNVETSCLVCETELSLLKIQCSDCETVSYFYEDDDIAISLCKCGKRFSIEDLVDLSFTLEQLADMSFTLEELIKSDIFDPDDIIEVFDKTSYSFDDITLIYCRTCEHLTPTVIPNNSDSEWICVSCGETYDRISQCEWCMEFVGGYLEDSDMEGCGVNDCEGGVGYQMSKDD